VAAAGPDSRSPGLQFRFGLLCAPISVTPERSVQLISAFLFAIGPVCSCLIDYQRRFLLVLLVDCCRVEVGLVLSYRIKSSRFLDLYCSQTVVSETHLQGVRRNTCDDIN
jgi:hypothetical protein